jgi:hypothetical protein
MTPSRSRVQIDRIDLDLVYYTLHSPWENASASGNIIPWVALTDETRWDEKTGLRRDAVRSQVINALEAQEIKETGNEEG